MRYHLVTPLLALLCLLSLSGGRTVKRRPEQQDTLSDSCDTNSECLQKGLPILAPRTERPRMRRQVNGFVQVTDSTCGRAQSVVLPPGRYQVAVLGASGAFNGRAGAFANAGGAGAGLSATFTVARNITVSYFIGCPGRAEGGSGGGGGGTFVYLPNTNVPPTIGAAIIVAGGGGGGGFLQGNRGQPASIILNAGGQATQGDGTPGATNGAGGQLFPGDASGNGGGGGGGFITAGATVPGVFTDATGGSQSINYGGTFAGGRTGDATGPVSGGAGSGGGAGYYGGGGGGGFSGGGSGPGTLSQEGNQGGGGGGSYFNANSPGGITVTFIGATNANVGSGSLSIAKIA